MKHARWFEPLLSALLALAAVGAALVSQHRFDMQPCPWCVLQRLIFVAGAAIGLTEAACGRMMAHGAGHTLRGLALLRGLVAASGLAAAAWQHVVASATASCNLTLADRLMAWTGLDGWLPDIFQARASCLDAKAWILGVPYELWSAALFLLLLLLAGRSVMSRPAAISPQRPA